jgi:methylated-DNA-[protein]-cysteine S-methyltransferase
MVGRGYTVFDSIVGRCGIAWGDAGVVGVQLAELREIETRRKLLRHFPDARDTRPPPEITQAIDAVVGLLRGAASDVSGVPLDMAGLAPFNRRVYQTVRGIPRGETATYADIAARLGASGATNAVAQALARNPFPILVPCHRVLSARGETSGAPTRGGVVTKFRLLTIEGALKARGPTLFDALLSMAPSPPAG